MKSLRQYILERAKQIQGLNGYSYDEIIEIIQSEVERILSDAEIQIDEIEIVEIWLHGSRLRGTAKDSSDLDAVMFYKGRMKEDSLFNILHDADKDEIEIEGITVDVNPIHIQTEQDINRYKKKSDEYDLNILKAN